MQSGALMQFQNWLMIVLLLPGNYLLAGGSVKDQICGVQQIILLKTLCPIL